MARTRTVDDFTAIRARVEELRRERERAEFRTNLRSDLPVRPGRSIYWPDVEIGAGPNGIPAKGG